MNTNSLIVAGLILIAALLIGSGLKSYVSELLKSSKVEKQKFTLAMRRG